MDAGQSHLAWFDEGFRQSDEQTARWESRFAITIALASLAGFAVGVWLLVRTYLYFAGA